MAKKSPAISDKELEMTYSGPAPIVNKFYVTTMPFGVRLTFAEEQSKVGPAFRSAVFLSPVDCRVLRDLLHSTITTMEAAHETAPKGQTIQ